MSSAGLSRLDVDSYYNFEGVEDVKLALARGSLEVDTLALTEVELDLLRREGGPVSEKSKLLIDDELLVDMTTAELNKMCRDNGWEREFASGDRRVGESLKWEVKRRREWLRRERESRERRQKYLVRFGATRKENSRAGSWINLMLAKIREEAEEDKRKLDEFKAEMTARAMDEAELRRRIARMTSSHLQAFNAPVADVWSGNDYGLPTLPEEILRRLDSVERAGNQEGKGG